MKKIRVIVNGVSFYTSNNAIVRGVGDDQNINKTVRLVYAELLKLNNNKGTVGVGYSDKDGYQVQIDYV
jgi:hypothetical protein